MKEIREIKIKDKGYPEPLTHINDRPTKIYVRGTIPPPPYFAVVGTRRYSEYGKRAALDITAGLARAGLVIVSGMAKGIDTFAHRSCLEENGQTVAILGTGIDEKSIYPKDNLALSRQIIKNNGALVSEYKPGTPGYKSNFLKRNRLISGFSLGVLVVEAKSRSGALNTARWAKEQGKKLFAVPGSIYSLNSRGTNTLIKKGAAPVTSARDIIKELRIKKLKLRKKRNKKEELGKKERAILKKIAQKPLHVEEIIKKSGLKAAEVCSILTSMESKGIIKEFGANTYTINKNYEISDS